MPLAIALSLGPACALAALFALVPAAPASSRLAAALAGEEVRAEGVTIEAVRGRLRLDGGGTAARVLGAGHSHEAPEEGRLELGALGEASVRWPGRASVRLIGPARVLWSAAEVATGGTTSRGGLRCVVLEARYAGFEVRDGDLVVEVDEAWTLRSGRGAFVVEQRSGRASEVALQAGTELSLEHRSGPFVEPARTLSAGERVRLLPPERRPRAPTPESAPWGEVVWPFGEPVGPTEPASRPVDPTLPAAPPPATGPGSVPVTDEVGPGVRPESLPDSEPAMPEPVKAAPAPELAPPGLEPAAPPAPIPTEVTAAPPAASTPKATDGSAPAHPPGAGERPTESPLYHPADWRGLRAAQLARVGPLVLARGALERLLVRFDEQGRLEVSLPASATEPAACFTQRYDIELRPGACALFDPSGRMVARVGSLKVEAAPVGRPSAEAAGIDAFPAASRAPSDRDRRHADVPGGARPRPME